MMSGGASQVTISSKPLHAIGHFPSVRLRSTVFPLVVLPFPSEAPDAGERDCPRAHASGA